MTSKTAATAVLTALLAASVHLLAEAAPYFRPGLNEVKAGGFQALGEGGGVSTLVIIPTIIHRAEDGHLLIPGVTWNLLDLGYSHGGGRPDAFHFGPSVNIDEPVKQAMRSVCRDLLPGWDQDDRYSFLRSAFAADTGKENGLLSLGPSFRVVVGDFGTPESWTGRWGFAFTVSKRFGATPAAEAAR